MINARVWRGPVRQRLWQTGAAAAIAATAIGAGVGLSGSVAGAAPTPAGTTAATWLKGQLKTGDHYDTTVTTSVPSVGLTVDGTLAFAAAGTTGGTNFKSQITSIIHWLDSSANIGGYIGNTTTGYQSGGLANVALAVEAAQHVGLSYTPTLFAGTDLITDLESTRASTGNFDGGFTDPTIQALAIIVIKKSDPTYAGLSTAVSFLESQACTTHSPHYGYPSTYTPTYGACAVSATGGDVDTTGAVAQALLYYGTPGAVTAAEEANTWLNSVKTTSTAGTTWQSFCGFGTTYTSPFASANSTALAVDGLVNDPRAGTTPYKGDITGGVDWLKAAQNANGSLPGCTVSGTGNVRATTQGVQGLTEMPWTALI